MLAFLCSWCHSIQVPQCHPPSLVQKRKDNKMNNSLDCDPLNISVHIFKVVLLTTKQTHHLLAEIFLPQLKLDCWEYNATVSSNDLRTQKLSDPASAAHAASHSLVIEPSSPSAESPSLPPTSYCANHKGAAVMPLVLSSVEQWIRVIISSWLPRCWTASEIVSIGLSTGDFLVAFQWSLMNNVNRGWWNRWWN